MNTEFIPYEQALALKELGFDEENCFGRWTTYPDGEGYLDTTAKSVFQGQDSMNRQCLAPLYQQVFRWFREKYGFLGVPNWYSGGFYCYTIKDATDKVSPELFTEFLTYEEAELECLKKLIEKCKNN